MLFLHCLVRPTTNGADVLIRTSERRIKPNHPSLRCLTLRIKLKDIEHGNINIYSNSSIRILITLPAYCCDHAFKHGIIKFAFRINDANLIVKTNRSSRRDSQIESNLINGNIYTMQIKMKVHGLQSNNNPVVQKVSRRQPWIPINVIITTFRNQLSTNPLSDTYIRFKIPSGCPLTTNALSCCQFSP